MKLKFKQSLYISSLNKVVYVTEEVEVDDQVLAEELIAVDFAVEVITDKPKRTKSTKQETIEVVGE